MAFRERLEGLLSGGNPMFNFGVGLLGASPGATFGQGVAGATQFANERQMAMMQNQAVRDAILQQQKQRAAQEQLKGLLASGVGPEQEMLGLLADISPDAFAQTAITSLLGGGERSDPADLRMMDALGLPRTTEGFAKFQALKADEGNKEMLDALNLQIQGLQLAGMRREQEQEEQQARETRLTRQNAIQRGIEQTVKIAELTKRLEGTALAAGLPASEWRRSGIGALAAVGGALGFDTEDINADITAFDQFKKNVNDQLINLMSAGSLGQATDSKLQQYRDSLANPDTAPGAVMAIQAGIAETLLDQADVLQIDIKDRQKLEDAIEEMRNYVPPGAETVIDVPSAAAAGRKSVVRVADIARMSVEQLSGLDPSQMTIEMLQAARKRWDEISYAR